MACLAIARYRAWSVDVSICSFVLSGIERTNIANQDPLSHSPAYGHGYADSLGHGKFE